MEIGFLQEIKAIIKSLVVSYPQQISIDKLNKDFYQTEGHNIPYGKLGFKNLESFLRSISDTVTIQGHGTMATVHYVANNKANHIHDMIKTQKKSRPRTRTRTRNTRPMAHHQSYSDGSGNNRSNSRFGSHSVVKREDRVNDNLSFHGITRNAVSFTDHHKNRITSDKLKPQPELPQFLKYDPKKTSPAELHRNNTVNSIEKLKDSPQKKIVSIKPKQEPIEIERAVKPSIVKFVDKVEVRCDSKSNEHHPIAEKVDKKIVDITKQFTDCVNLTSQQYSGTPNTQTVLNIDKTANDQQYSSSQPYHGTTNTKTVLTIDKTASDSNGHIADFFKLSSTSKDNFDDMGEAVPLFAANNLVFRLDFPENTVVFGKKIKPFTLPNDIKKGSIIGIFISEIHNPFKFWFHIHKENHQLDFLMHNIERFYTSLDSDEFVIPLSCHTPGQICSALYNNLWHRAEIIGTPINNKTKVFFLDYGTVSDVSVDNIKYLASMFANIPSQAVRGCLSHIKPRGLHWTHEATKYFLSLVCELMLYGQVTEIDDQHRTVHMVICNTNGPEITQVNKMMVENKFAQYDEEWMNQRIEKNGLRWHHIREDFPTFEMLEKGEYPSLSEVVDLLNRNIDYERIIDRKMFHHGKMNCHENAPEALRNLPFILLNTNPFRCDIIMELHRRIKFI